MAVTFENVAKAYNSGVLSQSEALYTFACVADTIDEEAFKSYFPFDLLIPLKEYLNKYRPGEMIVVFDGPEPSQESMRRLNEWMARVDSALMIPASAPSGK